MNSEVEELATKKTENTQKKTGPLILKLFEEEKITGGLPLPSKLTTP